MFLSNADAELYNFDDEKVKPLPFQSLFVSQHLVVIGYWSPSPFRWFPFRRRIRLTSRSWSATIGLNHPGENASASKAVDYGAGGCIFRCNRFPSWPWHVSLILFLFFLVFSYSESDYFKQAMRQGGPAKPREPRIPRMPQLYASPFHRTIRISLAWPDLLLPWEGFQARFPVFQHPETEWALREGSAISHGASQSEPVLGFPPFIVSELHAN